MSINKKPYELSIWEDQLVNEPANVSYYKEVRLAIIGSSEMTGNNMAYDIVFSKNMNGERHLKFSLKYKYYDPTLEASEVINPFAGLLVNERKVKLFYDGEWYDFIIKEHSEAKDGYEWTYDAVDAFVHELSKNGYGITFNSDLNNNQGTAGELASKTLEDTDWTAVSVDLAPPEVNEPIYEGVVAADFYAHRMDTDEKVLIDSGTRIFVFYSYIANQNGKFLQFIKRTNDDVYDIDDNNNIMALNYRLDKDVVFNTTSKTISIKGTGGAANTLIINYTDIYSYAQAYRTVFNQLTTYDSVMERTVDQYVCGDELYYHYTDYSYTTSNVVVSYLTNGDNFNLYEDGSLQGWSRFGSNVYSNAIELQLTTYPKIDPLEELIPIDELSLLEGYLETKFKSNGYGGKSGSYLFNSGVEDNSYVLNTISKGEQFILRWRAGKASSQHGTLSVGNAGNMGQAFGAIVAPYTTVLTKSSDGKDSYYQKVIDTDNIILHFTPANNNTNILNNIISSGELRNNNCDYWVDGVVQAPSSRYVYRSGNSDYVYDAKQKKYVAYNVNNYMNYYYLIATATQSVSRETLSDPTNNFGVFIYTTDSSKWYYIQDIQLTRYYKDADNKPITIGNIPTAKSEETDYYYAAPKVGTSSDKVRLYTTIEALASAIHVKPSSIVPVYNSSQIPGQSSQGYSLEKVLSIEASKSNCFNILQTIAETFECWIDLQVNHDANGAISLDEYGHPTKCVYLRRFSGKDNFAGFRGGINLNSIDRTVDSSEIVTKLIVDDVQSDTVDSGIVSIQNAASNVSQEAYIYNFDYFLNQGLISNREECEQDLRNFEQEVRQINVELKEKQKHQADLELSLVHIDSSRNVYTTLVEEAKEKLDESYDEFKTVTGWTYSQYQSATKEKKQEILNSELLKIDTVNEIIGSIYTCNSVINNYQGIVNNLDAEHKKLELELYGSQTYTIKISRLKDDNDVWVVRVVVSDYITPFGFTLNGINYSTNINTRIFEIETSQTRLNSFVYSSNKYRLVNENDQTVSYVDAQASGVITLRLKPINVVQGLIEKIDNLVERKNQVLKAFNNKYSRFIQEGNWSSQDYLSDELYYLDALQISRVSSHPKVSYNISAVDLSTVEEFEGYNFETGDKTFIEDIEFFGWGAVNVGTAEEPRYIKTPARESVIISEVEWHLDNPTENNITIQNYKTRFEDLFQRIQATVQTVQYNEATYAKTSSIINNNGTLKESILIEALNNTTGRQYQLTSDGSVLIEKDIILIQNLKNASDVVKISSNGISISDDGGLTWSVALSGRGVNTNALYSGSIDTDKIFIGGHKNPSFKWDSNGLSAYKKLETRYVVTSDLVADPKKTYYVQVEQGGEIEYVDAGVVTTEDLLDPERTFDYYELNTPQYDFMNFVRFDQYGVYGINLREVSGYSSDYVAKSLDDVKENAQFAITWDGFFIRNSYPGGGRVEITSDNDFRILKKDPLDSTQEKEVIKIGALEWNGSPIRPSDSSVEPSLYGIRITNDDGVETFKTGSDGNIAITGAITALEGDFKGSIHVGDRNSNATHILIDGGYDNETHTYTGIPVIQTTNYADGAGGGWLIDADGNACFNNITARGAIKTAVFEYAEIQAIGGIFLFRPSSTIRGVRIGDTERGESSDDLVVTVEKPILFKENDWCKISNYTGSGEADDPDVDIDGTYIQTEDTTVVSGKTYYTYDSENDTYIPVEVQPGENPSEQNYFEVVEDVDSILQNNGLLNVYKISDISSLTPYEITLEGAAAMIGDDAAVQSELDLIGGALVNMGDESNSHNNYGIGINSSDNTVNLPARAISLFETVIHENEDTKVTYDYKGILGTLPRLNRNSVHDIYTNYMVGSQGIYTNNMYLGDANQFIAFYDYNGDKKLRIRANQIEFESPYTGWSDVDPTQGGHFVYRGSGTSSTPAGAGIITTLSDNPTSWGYNTWISTDGIRLRDGENSYATLDVNGLVLSKGGIEAGNSGTNDFVYLSTNDYELAEFSLVDTSQTPTANPTESNWYEIDDRNGYQLTKDTTIISNKNYYTRSEVTSGLTINNHTPSKREGSTDDAAWRQIIGQNFGVDASGAIYANSGRIGNAEISNGQLILGDGSVDETKLAIGQYITFSYGYSRITDPTTPAGWPEGYYQEASNGHIDEYEPVPSGTTYESGKYFVVDKNKPQLIMGNKETVAVTIDITSDNGQMTFWQNWQPVAYINNNRMTIPESVMLNEMKVGEKLWSWKHHGGNLCLKWLGD